MERQAKGEKKKLVKKSLVSHNPSPAKYPPSPIEKLGNLRAKEVNSGNKFRMLASRLFSLFRRNFSAFSSKFPIVVVHFGVSNISTSDAAADPS